MQTEKSVKNRFFGKKEKKIMKVITVQGECNRGKTALVKYVFETLKQAGAEILYYKEVGAYFEDIHCVLRYDCKVIAICSIGDIADEEEKDDWKYIKDGIELAKNYAADVLINVLSIPISASYQNDNSKGDVCDKTKKDETIKKYKDILKDKFSSDKYEPIELPYIEAKTGDYTPLQTRKDKCSEILGLIGFSNRVLCFPCCGKFRKVKINSSFSLDLSSSAQKRREFAFHNIAILGLLGMIVVFALVAIFGKGFDPTNSMLVSFTVIMGILITGIIASIIVSLCKTKTKNATELKTLVLSDMFSDVENFLSCPCNTTNSDAINAFKESVKSITNGIADC